MSWAFLRRRIEFASRLKKYFPPRKKNDFIKYALLNESVLHASVLCKFRAKKSKAGLVLERRTILRRSTLSNLSPLVLFQIRVLLSLVKLGLLAPIVLFQARITRSDCVVSYWARIMPQLVPYFCTLPSPVILLVTSFDEYLSKWVWTIATTTGRLLTRPRPRPCYS